MKAESHLVTVNEEFEAAFISLAHTDGDIQFTIEAIARALKSLKDA